MEARAENCVRLSRTLKDRWGLPLLEIDAEPSPTDRRLAEAQVACLERWLPGARAEVSSLGLACHEGGTARMGNIASASVLDPYQRCWQLPNLIVADAACLPSQGCLNPTLTLLALASRAVENLRRDLS
jgi:choline dehydrogenase-like flavoprotein